LQSKSNTATRLRSTGGTWATTIDADGGKEIAGAGKNKPMPVRTLNPKPMKQVLIFTSLVMVMDANL
jgi:hypothetical protein